MVKQNVVIAGYAETPVLYRSGRSVYELAAQAFEEIVQRTGIEKSDIDGFASTAALSEAGNAFHTAYLAEVLGLELSWLQSASMGGCSVLCAVAAAASALRDGRCRVAVVLGADAPSTVNTSRYGAYRAEFQDPTGLTRPPGMFGLIQNAYAERYGCPDDALAKIVVTQRRHALLNERACAKLRTPLSVDDYLASRPVSDPLRLLDSVMFCDGANAVLMMTEATADEMGLSQRVRLTGYAEHTNYRLTDPQPDLLASGFMVAGPKALQLAGLSPIDLDLLQLYDDFTIAILLQLEHLGFCSPGQGGAWIRDTDFSVSGSQPLNTGGGQLSAGQPGLASGGLSLVEGVRQLFGEAGPLQVRQARNALITGIGGIGYARGWMMSNALVLER